MKYTILGGGLAGLSLAYFLQQCKDVEQILILEKESRTGGLCRSIKKDGYTYDIGPHILFSKDKEMLELMLSWAGDVNQLKRSNKILYKDRWIQYPFENDLSKLPPKELAYCIAAFENNPYSEYQATNMLQFFLKTFGEGITETYLRPYNEKIWKYDPCYMNVSMVERIPKPTNEEVRRSAAGETVEGYLHQLYFGYPSAGGIESVVRGLLNQLSDKCRIVTNAEIVSVCREEKGFSVALADGRTVGAEKLVSTIPVTDLIRCYDRATDELRALGKALRYNAIRIVFVKCKEDLCGENFTFTIPDKNVLFHRISKMDFLGDAYQSDGATYMVEVTYRPNDIVDRMSSDEFQQAVVQGLCSINFAATAGDVEIVNITDYPYAYVIYDINHAKNMTDIRRFFANESLNLHGRFGCFEYWNMDRILRESSNLATALAETD